MSERPRLVVAKRPLHFFILADCSGSMAADGRIQALNNAIREAIPHLRGISEQNPHAELVVRSIAFSTGARWHIPHPVPVADLAWDDLAAGGYTDLGAALSLLAEELAVPPMPERALPPAILLISDGLPTDDFRAGLGRLMDQAWGLRAVRVAVGIGREVDDEVLRRFIGNSAVQPIKASNPEELIRMLRWASVHAGRAASECASGAFPIPEATTAGISETIW